MKKVEVGTPVKVLNVDAVKYKYRNKEGEIIECESEYMYSIRLKNGEEIALWRSGFAVDEADEAVQIRANKVYTLLNSLENVKESIDGLAKELYPDDDQILAELDELIVKIQLKEQID